MEHLTITGTYRSGTTLVERLLDQHPAVSVATQPFPLLWTEAKRAFLADRGRADRLPLGTLFRDPDHVAGGLETFLRSWPAKGDEALEAVLDAQSGYSGAMSPDVRELPIHTAPDGPFPELVEWLQREVAALRGHGQARVFGAKEILIEEFIGLLLDAGHRVVVVVRDPRAVVASSVGGRGADWVGSPRPTLFTVRAWRRSADLALAHGSHPRCRVVRFEDVLGDRQRVTVALHEWMELQALDRIPEVLRDQYGEAWRANSSFDLEPTDPDAALARAREVLGPSAWDYIEATTAPELRALGYPMASSIGADEALERFVEPVPIVREDIPRDLSTRAESIDEERRRLELARTPLSAELATEWFLHPRAHERIREAGCGG